MDQKDNNENSNPEIKCRWSSYQNYRLLLWAWMMNEVTIVFTPSEVPLLGFYILGVIQICATIFIGIPLLYSEVCISQYTNCNIITFWDFFPMIRYVGFATIYLIIMKTIYGLVLTSWYLEYSFYAAVDPPPWYSCADFNDTKCMVKSVNVSVFQHCLEAESQFSDDCGMKTASNCFFEREIGGFNTRVSISCFFPWKTATSSTFLSTLLFFLSLKKEKFIQIFVKFLLGYVSVVVLLLSCAALSKSGTWYASSISLEWNSDLLDSLYAFNRGVLSLGTGCGIVTFLTRDVRFRSPATMASISNSLLATFFSVMLTLVAFSGIKNMVYFHGEELNVVEIGTSLFFVPFACMTEIMNYFEAVQLWSFTWFSAIFLCLFCHVWILFLFLEDLVLEMDLAKKYKNLTTAIILVVINVLSWPFFCSDFTTVLTDATEIMQLTNIFLFSFSLYWLYGAKNHKNDITFMIGIKASYFWKISWMVSPFLNAVILYGRWVKLEVNNYKTSYYIKYLGIRCDLLLLYIILTVYHCIIFFSIVVQIYIYYKAGELRNIFSPAPDWGPRDQTLYKSRQMFVPEIMTTEFLYRQVKVRGYSQQKSNKKAPVKQEYNDSSSDNVEWSALTSN